MEQNGGARLMVRITRQAVTSIGGFVIIALVAAAIIIGGVLFVKHRADVARHDQAVKVADDQSQTQNSSQSQTQTSTDNASTSSNDQTSNSATTDTTSNSATNSTTAGSTATNALPVTGPEDTFAQLVVVAVLTLSASFYIASRRARSNAI